jgi:hypothetical protein
MLRGKLPASTMTFTQDLKNPALPPSRCRRDNLLLSKQSKTELCVDLFDQVP